MSRFSRPCVLYNMRDEHVLDLCEFNGRDTDSPGARSPVVQFRYHALNGRLRLGVRESIERSRRQHRSRRFTAEFGVCRTHVSYDDNN